MCIGLNYADHARETEAKIPRGARHLLQGDERPLRSRRRPRPAPRLGQDRLGGRARGRDRPAARATSRARRRSTYVAGYALHNDYSERQDQHERGGQWSKGKSHDSFAPLGPFLATRDEIADPQALEMWLSVNGRMRQQQQHRPDDLRRPDARQLRQPLHDPAARRRDQHGHAVRSRLRRPAARVPEGWATSSSWGSNRSAGSGNASLPARRPRPSAWTPRRHADASPAAPSGATLEAFLVSTSIVALAEMGDKTQLLSFVLAARLKRRVPIILGHPGRDARQPLPRGLAGRLAREPRLPVRPQVDDRALLLRLRALGPQARHARGRPEAAGHRRLPDDTGRLLPRGDGRQDPARDDGAGGALRRARRRRLRHDARHDDRQRPRRLARRDARAPGQHEVHALGRRRALRAPGRC